jgi:pilus assembly protein Flp/PilA
MLTYALTWIKNAIDREEGVTAIEYGLIAALIAVAIIAAITIVGTELNTTFSTIREALQNANTDGGGGGS